jgi:hypothetical protein
VRKQAGQVSSPTRALLFASQRRGSDAGDIFESRRETQQQCCLATAGHRLICGPLADRLIELLPHPGSSHGAATETAGGLHAVTHSALAKILLCAALGATALIVAANREPSSQPNYTDVPASNAATPPQTSPPSSR